MTNRMLSAALGLTCLATAQTLTAQTWDAQVGLIDIEDSATVYIGSVDYYFQTLDKTGNTPWTEIAFVDRISSAGLILGSQSETLDMTEGGFGFNRAINKTDRTTINTSYDHRSPQSPHSFRANFGYTKFDESITVEFDFSSPQTFDFSESLYSYGLAYSYYLEDAWTAGVGIELNDSEIADSFEIAIATRRLWDLGKGKTLGLAGALVRSDIDANQSSGDSWAIELSGSYYFSPRTGISLELSLPEDGDSRNYEFNVHHFFSEKVYATAGYGIIEIDIPPEFQNQNFDSKVDSIQLSVGMQF